MKQANYMQIVKQSHEEKMAMYMKCTKKKLAEMLITCNDHIDNMPLRIEYRDPNWPDPADVNPYDSGAYKRLR